MADWEELPQDVLEHIALRLTIEDFLAFRGVCTSWRSAAAKEKYKAKPEALWLMTSWGYCTAKFSNLSTGRIYSARLPGCYAGTSTALGWIAVSDGGAECLIFNPLSRVSIKLPALDKLHHESCLRAKRNFLPWLRSRLRRIDMMALSSSPSLSSSYTVTISFMGETWVAFHRSGEDAWTVVSPATQSFHQLIYYDGLFVVMDVYGHILTLNERERRMELRLQLDLVEVVRPYLVECSGSLLVAFIIWGDEYGPVKKIRVFKVDLQKGNHEEIKSLGNASLLMVERFLVSVEFNAESCLPGIKPNHVYFTDHYLRTDKTYSMEDGEVVTCPFTISNIPCRSAWFQPTF